jgi:hypothetical protein
MRYPIDGNQRMHLLLNHFDDIKHCSCLTKTPCVEYHDPLCEYRVSMEGIANVDDNDTISIYGGTPSGGPLWGNTITIRGNTLTIDKLREIHDIMPSDPLEDWMRERGFDPKKGGRIILPKREAEKLGLPLPYYVTVSALVENPLLCIDPMHNTVYSVPNV